VPLDNGTYSYAYSDLILLPYLPGKHTDDDDDRNCTCDDRTVYVSPAEG